MGALQRRLRRLAGQLFRPQIDQHQMVVGAARDQRIAARQDRRGERLGVGDHRMGVVLEFRRQRLGEGDRLGGDHMHQRAALQARKDRRIDLFGEALVVGQDHAAARAAQGLVGRGGDDMGVRERRGMRAARHQPGEMRDIDDEISADRVADRPEPRKIPIARIGRAAGDDHLGPVLAGEFFDLVHVDAMGVAVDAVGDRLEPAPGHIDRRAVGEMAPRRQIEPHECFARLHQREKHALIGLAAGIRLHIGEPAREQPAGALDRQSLRDIDILAAAVIAPAGIPFRVFVGHHRALRLQHGARDDVFGGDQFDLVALAAQLQLDRPRDLRIGGAERRGKERIGADRLVSQASGGLRHGAAFGWTAPGLPLAGKRPRRLAPA